jgi:hypothetical protein
MASKADTRANYIGPALKAAQLQSTNIIREHFFTDDHKLAADVRGRWSYADALFNNESSCFVLLKTTNWPTLNKILMTSLLKVLATFDSEDSDLPKFEEDRLTSV